MDEKTRDILIKCEANALWEKLRAFSPRERLWILSEINTRVARKLRTGESTRYAIDFSSDEPPTKPSVNNQLRETRVINVDELQALREESKKDDDT